MGSEDNNGLSAGYIGNKLVYTDKLWLDYRTGSEIDHRYAWYPSVTWPSEPWSITVKEIWSQENEILYNWCWGKRNMCWLFFQIDESWFRNYWAKFSNSRWFEFFEIFENKIWKIKILKILRRKEQSLVEHGFGIRIPELVVMFRFRWWF